MIKVEEESGFKTKVTYPKNFKKQNQINKENNPGACC